MKKKLRQQIYDKFGGKCAYSGTILEEDWQAEHIKPIVRNIKKSGCLFPKDDSIENIIPVQKLINHYKHSLSLEEFRTWYLGKLHLRLQTLPKNPRTDKSKRKIEYMHKIAAYFGVSPEKPFNGKFYFETLQSN